MREAAIRVALVVASSMFVLLVLEAPAVVGLVDYRTVFRTPILSPARNPAYRIDPELIFVRQPHARLAGQAVGDNAFLFKVPDAQEYPYDLRYDRNGFRNPEDLTAADVAVIGDSFIESTLVPDDEMVTSLMAGSLNVDVANLGQIQYGPQQELVVLRRFALPLRPTVVVWVFFEGNDLGDALLYPEVMADFDGWTGSRHSFWPRSFTKNALQFVVRVAGYPRTPGLPRSALISTPESDSLRVYFTYPGHPLSARDSTGLDLTRAALASANELANEAEVKLVVAFAPTKFRVLQPFARFDPGSLAAGWTLNDLPDRIRGIVDDLDGEVAFVDLTDPLRESVRRGALPFRADDSHWNPTGSRVVAEVLVNAIRGMPDADPEGPR